MLIPKSSTHPFEPLGIPHITLGIKGGVSMSREELLAIQNAIYSFMDTFKHLDLMRAAGPDLTRSGMRLAALENGADWARSSIAALGDEHRAFVEFGKTGGRWQVFSAPVPRGKP